MSTLKLEDVGDPTRDIEKDQKLEAKAIADELNKRFSGSSAYVLRKAFNSRIQDPNQSPRNISYFSVGTEALVDFQSYDKGTVNITICSTANKGVTLRVGVNNFYKYFSPSSDKENEQNNDLI